MTNKDVKDVTAAWDCPYGDYDSLPIYEDNEIIDSIGIIEDCSKDNAPFCDYCPKRNK